MTRLTLELGKPAHGGACVARSDGRVVFVRHGLPGERVVAEVVEDRGSFLRADVTDVLDASVDRIERACPVAGPGGAGCCDVSHANLSAQRSMKQDVVEELLGHHAQWTKPVPVEGLSDEASGWRTRIRLAVGDGGQVGLHRFRSSELAPAECAQFVPGATDRLTNLAWTPGAELVVVIDSDGERHVAEVVEQAPATKRRGRRVHRVRQARPKRSIRAYQGGDVIERVGSRTWELGVDSFWQPHRLAATTYADLVGTWAGLAPGDVAWDLYCGAGVFAGVLADQVGPGGEVIGLEAESAAVERGRAALSDLSQVTLITSPVSRGLDALDRGPQCVVLDPPRAGAGREVIEKLAAFAPQRIIHVGCDPMAFARDVALYQRNGFQVEQIRAFDAFPMTHHVECFALLTRV